MTDSTIKPEASDVERVAKAIKAQMVKTETRITPYTPEDTELWLNGLAEAAINSMHHCKDCCCARAWAALGITEYTGKSISEHIEELRKRVADDEEERWPIPAGTDPAIAAAALSLQDSTAGYYGLATVMKAIEAYEAARDTKPVSGWQPIETCPDNEPVFFAWYCVPSEEAQRNGSQAYWTYGQGAKILSSNMINPLYTGILGGKPSHWMKITPPRATEQESV